MCFFSAALSPLLRQRSGGKDEESTELTAEVCFTLVPVHFNRAGLEKKKATWQSKSIISLLYTPRRLLGVRYYLQHRFLLTILEKKRTMKTILRPEHEPSGYEKKKPCHLQEGDFQGFERPT